MSTSNASVMARNNVRLVGSGSRTLVLAHGFGTEQSVWKSQVEDLSRDFRVLLFDHVGAGATTLDAYSPRRYATLRSYASDLLEVLDAAGVDRCSYVGHSMSGMVGVLAAREAPQRFEKMILLGASPRYLDDPAYRGGFGRADLDQLYGAMSSNFHAWASGFAPMVMGNTDRPELAATFARSLSAMRPDVALAVARVIFESDHRPDLKDMDVKTLVVQSRDDVAVPVQVGEYLARSLPNARMALIDATGHLPHVSAPGLVTRVVRDELS
jgi:sigma-B regulation protein RsbQ